MREGSIAISPDNQFVGAVAVDESVGMWELRPGNKNLSIGAPNMEIIPFIPKLDEMLIAIFWVEARYLS